MTIHRLLGFNGLEKEEETEREVKGRLIIIDEMSMVDTWLAHQLLKALADDVQLLFVGDQDQLPPVGPGQVLRDMLESNKVPVVELTEIYRQSAGSTIIEMAHMIKRSEWSTDITQKHPIVHLLKQVLTAFSKLLSKLSKMPLPKGITSKIFKCLRQCIRGRLVLMA